MIVSDYALVGLVALIVVGAALLAAALWRPPARPLRLPPAWAQYRFGFVTYALIFLSFDMEMIFMYPWAVVLADMGATAVIEMFGFLAVLLVGVTYVWREGALRWT